MKKVLVILSAAMMSLAVMAQHPERAEHPQGPQAQHHCQKAEQGCCQKAKAGQCCKMQTPEQKAGKLTEHFNLSEEQNKKLVALFKKQDEARKKEMVKQAKAEDKKREKAKKQMAKDEQQLGKIIGEENLKVLKQEQAERAEKMRLKKERERSEHRDMGPGAREPRKEMHHGPRPEPKK